MRPRGSSTSHERAPPPPIVSTHTEVEALLLTEANDAVVLQAPIIVGPYSKPWVERPIEQFGSGWIVVPNRGRGSMNAVFVEDVARALVAAGTTPSLHGERMLLSGFTVRWAEFYERLEAMFGRERVTYAESKKDYGRIVRSVARRGVGDLLAALSDEEIVIRAERIPYVEETFDAARRRLPKLVQAFKRQRAEESEPAALPTPAVEVVRSAPPPRTPPDDARLHLPDPHQRALFASDVTVSSAKAKAKIGYAPRFDFETTMKILEDFARWANLI